MNTSWLVERLPNSNFIKVNPGNHIFNILKIQHIYIENCAITDTSSKSILSISNSPKNVPVNNNCFLVLELDNKNTYKWNFKSQQECNYCFEDIYNKISDNFTPKKTNTIEIDLLS
jgi:hypothetical protein